MSRLIPPRIDPKFEKRIRLDEHSYHYWDQGSGFPLLLLNGLGGSAYDWRSVFPLLVDAGFRVLAFEILGVGHSDKPAKADYGISAQSRRATRLLRALGIDRAHVAGNSYGGALALRLAVETPDLVDRLLLLDVPAIPQAPPFHVRLLRARGVAELTMSLSPRKVLVHTILREVLFDPGKVRAEEVEEYAREAGLPGTARALIEIARQIDFDEMRAYVPRYRGIRSPTSILWGAEDLVTPLRCGRRLAEAIPGARFRVFPRCGHCPQMEYPNETASWMQDAIRGAISVSA